MKLKFKQNFFLLPIILKVLSRDPFEIPILGFYAYCFEYCKTLPTFLFIILLAQGKLVYKLKFRDLFLLFPLILKVQKTGHSLEIPRLEYLCLLF